MKTAVVAGHICIDVLPEMSHLPPGDFVNLFQPGHLISVGEAMFSTGGPVSNVGLALHKLGIPTRLIAKTGKDPYGQILQQIIAGYDAALLKGVSTAQDQPTSYSVIISPPGVDRIFLHCPGVNDAFNSDDIDYALLAESDLMHFGYPPIMQQMYEHGGMELVEILRQAKQTGITTSLDMAFPDPASPGGQADWREILQSALPYVDIFTPSVEEIMFMLHQKQYAALTDEFEDILDGVTPQMVTDLALELLEMGARIVLLKLGHLGVFLQTSRMARLKQMGRAAPSNIEACADKAIWSPCYQVDVVGTTGSGDATIAGFLSAVLRDLSLVEAVDAAVAVGASNVEASDALSGLQSWEETMDRIARGWKKHSMESLPSGWLWDSSHQLWVSIT